MFTIFILLTHFLCVIIFLSSTLRCWLYLIFKKNKFSPLNWKKPYTEMLFWQFPNIVGKIPDQHLNVWLFSNPGDRVQKRWRTMGKICPVLSTRIWTLSPGLENNHTLKCVYGIFPTTLNKIMLEKCQNNISVYGCSPIQGTTFCSCWNLLKPGSQSGT